MSRRAIVKERFTVIDEDGDKHEVIHRVEQVDATTDDDDQTDWLDVQEHLQLTSGGPVNKLSDTEYELVSLGVRAKRV